MKDSTGPRWAEAGRARGALARFEGRTGVPAPSDAAPRIERGDAYAERLDYAARGGSPSGGVVLPAPAFTST